MTVWLGDPVTDVQIFQNRPCPKCGISIWQKPDGLNKSHDLMECDAAAFAQNPGKYGMVSVLDLIMERAASPEYEQFGYGAWCAARDFERILAKLYPKVTYKIFYRENNPVYGAFVEEWAAAGLRAFYAQGGYADLDVLTYLEKMYNDRR